LDGAPLSTAPRSLLPLQQISRPHRHPHRMVPLIHVDRRPRDSAAERAGEERGGGADFPSGEWLREGSVGAVVLHHLLDLADRAGGARGERARRDRVHPHAVLAPGLECERAPRSCVRRSARPAIEKSPTSLYRLLARTSSGASASVSYAASSG